VFLISLYC